MRRAIATFVLASAAAAAQAQDFLSVPYVVTNDPETFRALFNRGRAGPGIHALVIGDSQETCPTGMGMNYVPSFNAAWARRYGVSPRTPLVQPGINFSSPNAEWLVSGVNLSPAVAPPAVGLTTDTLPGLSNWSLPAPTGAQRGWAMLLQPRATGVSPALPIDHTRTWIDMSQGVYLDVYALRSAGNLTVTCALVPADTLGGDGRLLLRASTTLDQTPDTGPVARQRFGPLVLTVPPPATVQAELLGAEPGNPARVISASFASVASDVGLTATDIANGGYNSTSLLTNHAEALPQLRGLGVDVVFINFGANDIWNAPGQFKQNLAALIAALRENTTPDLPVVILIDPARGASTPVADANAELFPRVAAELAGELHAVCVVNSRRLTHEQGWTPTNLGPFTTDQIHFSVQGATLKSELEVGTIWRAFVCPADVGSQGGNSGSDGQFDNNDFVAFISAFFASKPIADMGSPGGTPGADGRFDSNDYIVFISDFFTGCN